MPESVEALLWCAALATWLMILFTVVSESVQKVVHRVRGKMSRQHKVARSSFRRDEQPSGEPSRPEQSPKNTASDGVISSS